MDKFTPEYIQNVQQIIKNDEKDKARELLKDLHANQKCHNQQNCTILRGIGNKHSHAK